MVPFPGVPGSEPGTCGSGAGLQGKDEMRSRDVLTGFIGLVICIALVSNVFAGVVEELKDKQIAVEKLTGRGDTYGLNFSGWVGSMKINPASQRILISEFSDLGGKAVVVSGSYKIQKIDQYENSLNFECTDEDTGIDWYGKVWLTDSKELKVEMVQKQSSRKWVNLGDYGRKYLKDIKLEGLFLGV